VRASGVGGSHLCGESGCHSSPAGCELPGRWQIMRLLRTVVQAEGITALVATHDSALLELADDVVHLEDGRLV
jgi:ABC-type ATPase involved in cell division